MPVFVGISGESLSNRVTPPDTYGTGLYRLDDFARGEWVRVGGGLPPDPEIRALVANPMRPLQILAGTQYGVHISNDGGATWQAPCGPRPEYSVWSLAVHPTEPDVLLAGYEPGAVARSNDGGRTWRLARFDVSYVAGTEAEPRRVIGLAFDPRDPAHIYGAVEVGGIIKSEDGGWSWRLVSTSNDADLADAHAVAVGAAGVVACTRVGVVRSEDRGRTWIPSLTEHLEVGGVAVANVERAIEAVSQSSFGGNLEIADLEVRAGLVRFRLGARVAGRVDYGGDFDPNGRGARRDAEGRVRAAACHHALGAVVATLLREHPEATIETALARVGAVRDTASCDCNEPDGTTKPAAMRDAMTWSMAEAYCRCVSVADDGLDLCVGVGRGYMSTHGAVYRSRDGGRTWRPMFLPDDIASGVFGIAHRSRELVCAARDGQLYASRDDGETWLSRRTPPGADPIYALLVA